jgi:hypothetical protein
MISFAVFKSRATLVVATLLVEALMAGLFQNCGSSEGTVIEPAEFQAGGQASTQKWQILLGKEPSRRSSLGRKTDDGTPPAVCDGIADDTQSLQAIFDEASAVRIPENSRCKITGPLYIRHGLDVSAEHGVEFHLGPAAAFVIQSSHVTFASFRVLSEDGGIGCQFEIDDRASADGARLRNILVADLSSQNARCFIRDDNGYVASDGLLYKNINAGVRDNDGRGPVLAGALSDRQ